MGASPLYHQGQRAPQRDIAKRTRNVQRDPRFRPPSSPAPIAASASKSAASSLKGECVSSLARAIRPRATRRLARSRKHFSRGRRPGRRRCGERSDPEDPARDGAVSGPQARPRHIRDQSPRRVVDRAMGRLFRDGRPLAGDGKGRFSRERRLRHSVRANAARSPESRGLWLIWRSARICLPSRH
jgi:hypothetical protein